MGESELPNTLLVFKIFICVSDNIKIVILTKDEKTFTPIVLLVFLNIFLPSARPSFLYLPLTTPSEETVRGHGYECRP